MLCTRENVKNLRIWLITKAVIIEKTRGNMLIMDNTKSLPWPMVSISQGIHRILGLRIITKLVIWHWKIFCQQYAIGLSPKRKSGVKLLRRGIYCCPDNDEVC